MATKRIFPRKLLQVVTDLSSRFFPKELQRELRRVLHELNVYRVRLERDNRWLRRTQAELEDTCNRVLDLFENAPIGYLTLDLHGLIKAANATACRLFGFPREYVLAHSFSSFVASADREALRQHLSMSRGADRQVVTKLRLSDSSGKERLVQLVSERWSPGEDGPMRSEIRTALVDVSGWEAESPAAGTQIALAYKAGGVLNHAQNGQVAPSKEKQLQDMIDASSAMIFVKDLNGRYLLTNRQLERMLGKARGELKGKTDRDIFPRRLANIYRDHDRIVLESGKPEQMEETIELADGRRHTFLADKFPLLDGHGRGYAVCTILQDITDRKEMEKTLRESEERIRFHIENSPLAEVEWEGGEIISRWSREAARMFGWTAEEAIGKTMEDLHLVYPDDLTTVQRTKERLASGEESAATSENRNMTKDGRVISCVWYNSVMTDARGHMVSVLSRVQDVTAERNSRAQLEKAVQSLSVLVANSKENVVLFDDDGKIRCVSESAATLVGYSAEALEGRSWTLLLPASQLLHARFCFADLKTHPETPTVTNLKLRTASGDFTWFGLSASTVSLGDSDGYLVYIDPIRNE